MNKNKVPQVTIAFWVIKILATTLGETAGDALSMTVNLGYLVSTAIYFTIFVGLLTAQVASDRYRPWLYWAVIVATTTAGTTLSDYLDRSLGLGYPLASALLFSAVLVVLAVWRFTTGSASVNRITSRTDESFYWITIFVSNTLGTALGDFLADSSNFGFEGGALVFGAALAALALAYYATNMSRTLLFWAAFILTRPLGATLGDILTKPVAQGGLDLSRIASSLVLAAVMGTLIALAARKAEEPLEA